MATGDDLARALGFAFGIWDYAKVPLSDLASQESSQGQAKDIACDQTGTCDNIENTLQRKEEGQ